MTIETAGDDRGDGRVLDPLALPLRGSRLIEASAGTGKTWTIAALYLRLVLGHGRGPDDPAPTACARPLAPAEILVMTFTRAATRELSDRIRARLVEAARCFRGESAPGERDGFLRELLAAYPDGPARAHAAWRLAMAAESMDDAAVMTLDSWCQRMLREHAFDSGSVYDEELQPDEAGLRAEAVRDYWRHEVYPLSGEALERVLATWPGVAALEDDVKRLLPLVPPARDDAPLAARLHLEMAAERVAVAQLKAGWAARLRVLRAWMMGAVEPPSPFKGNVVNAERVRGWFDELDRWAADPSSARWRLEDKDTRWLSPAGLREALKKGAHLDFPPEVAHLDGLAERVAELSSDPHWMREHAAAHVGRRIRDLKARAGTFGFSDLQERLDTALAGPHGERLRERLVTQFPAVLVDEFQDTSPVQYRILDRLYRIEHDDPATALFLIGDPKQSIYAFRGADLHSYLRARRATRGRHSVLGRNYRSTGALVDAVNALFLRAERRGGRGAFLFGERQAALLDAEGEVAGAGRGGEGEGDGARAVATEVPFEAVSAAGRREALHDADGPAPALVACVDAAGRKAEPLRRSLAARCAEDIVRRLQDPAAGFHEPGRPFRRLRPGDIAVIVRSGREATAVRRALRRRDVPSVYLSDQDSVFETREAADLLRWLRAVADPLDGALARAAWASSTVDLPLPALAALRRDDVAFESRVEILRTLHQTWRRQGVLPMLRQTLHLLDLPARWLAQPEGERRLTNLLHLAELLQAAAARCEGEHALIRWLAAQVTGRGSVGDEKLVRLESDADLVQIVTGHKSKGLEYPVVYLPFACSFRGAEQDRQGFVTQHDAGLPTGRRVVFGASPKAGDPSDEARLQEDLRWLYVALTRPRHLLWLGVGAVMQATGKSSRCVVHRSALGYLLAGEAPVEASSLPARVAAAFEGVAGVRIEQVGAAGEAVPGVVAVPEEVSFTRLARRDDHAPLVEAPVYTGRFDRRWTIGSFSRLVRDLGHEAAPRVAADAQREAMWQEMVVDEAGVAGVPERAAPPDAVGGEVDVEAAIAPAHRFPRGAFAGNFLHEQLEWLAGHRFALADDPVLAERLAQRCQRQGWGNRAADVGAWLARVVSRPLPPFGAPLSRLSLAQAEMEFWLPGEGGRAARLDALCKAFLMPGRRRPELPDRTLRGMLMGFADLVVEHEGRRWVLDYKSNALGAGDADYSAGALQEAVASHRYDVQAAIYLLALHRLLKSRLGEAYDPATQVGGAVFLFLRGIDGPEAGCVTLPAPPAFLEALDRVLADHDEEVRT